MARQQNSARGYFSKNQIGIGANTITGNSTGILLSGGIRLSAQANAFLTGNSTGLAVVGGVKLGAQQLTKNSTGVIFSGGVTVSAAQLLTANSTGIVFGNPVAALPGDVDGGVQLAMVSNSTGVALAVCTTGTTWYYLSTTSVQPT